jgi:hypothetical protein
MSVTLRPSELSRNAIASRAEAPAPKDPPKMHHINQLRPKGADKDYANGPFNCGPAVVAMLARQFGKAGHLNDAQLVSELGKGLVTRDGTSPEGIAQMMERADVPLGGKALGAGYTDAQVKDNLLKGQKMIAQVRSSNPDNNKDAAHYVLVEGMTKDGNYVISDPLAKGPYVVSPRLLKDAVLNAPPDGGMLIPVANPADAKTAAPGTAAPGAVAPGTPVQGAVAPGAVPVGAANEAVSVPDMSMQTPSEAVASGRSVTGSFRAIPRTMSNPNLGAIRGMDSFVGPMPTPTSAAENLARTQVLSAPGFMPTATPVTARTPSTTAAPLILSPNVGEKVSEAEAFTATEEAFKGVDTEFKETENKPSDSRLAQNDKRNNFNLDVRYGGGPSQNDEPKRAVTGDNHNLGDFIRNLLNLKSRGDEKAYKTLGQLENSTFAEDKQVLAEFKQSDKKDRGIGVKTRGDAF